METIGKQAASRKAARRLRVSARRPPTTPTRTDATVMHAHWTDWNAPVRPRGRPFSTIIASTRTSVNARPSAMSVKSHTPATSVKLTVPTIGSVTPSVSIVPSEIGEPEARRSPASAASPEVTRK